MSWDGYIDNLIQSSGGNIDRACIIGLDGGSSWTTDAHASGLKLQGQEGPNIAKCFKNKDFTPFMSGGIHLEGVKYQFLREEDEKLVLGKKKDCGALTIQSSKSAIVIAHTKEGCQQGNSNKAVAGIAEYLEGSGL